MSNPVSAPISGMLAEHAIMHFDVLGESKMLRFSEAYTYVEALLDTANRAALVFTAVIAARTAIGPVDKDGALEYSLGMWKTDRQLSVEQFLDILNYQLGISNEDWSDHLNKISMRVEYLQPSP